LPPATGLLFVFVSGLCSPPPAARRPRLIRDFIDMCLLGGFVLFFGTHENAAAIIID
jgi:hypothetical protein